MNERTVINCLHGSTLNDYIVTCLLGSGSIGRVFEVHCIHCDKGFALKTIDKNLVQQRGLIQKLVNEIEVHKKLKHECILELYQCFEDNECVYLLLELCKSGDLSTYIKSHTSIPEPQARWIFKRIAEGVGYLHDRYVVHRDLKPTNILLTEQGDIKIGDFGVAVQLKDLNEEHDTMCGTENYVSPEIVSHRSHGIQTDIWSLGCMWHSLLFGKPPFMSLNELQAHNSFNIPSDISEDAAYLLKSTLNFDPKQRINVKQILSLPYIAEAHFNTHLSCLNFYNRKPPISHSSVKDICTYKKQNKKSVTEKKKVKTLKNIHRQCNSSYKGKHKSLLQYRLNTERLKPITHHTPHGYIKVDHNLFVEMEIDGKTKIMRITPDGQKVSVHSKLVSDCNMQYEMPNIPHYLHPAYKYAYDFVNVLKLKIPKVICKNSEYVFYMMDNEPHQNCELYMNNGAKAIHIIGSHKVDILNSDGSKISIDNIEEYKSWDIIDILFKAIKVAKDIEGSNKEFPIIVNTLA